jgi:hypothetical protein
MQKNIQKYKRQKICTKPFAQPKHWRLAGKSLAHAKNLVPPKSLAPVKNSAPGKILASMEMLAQQEKWAEPL